nr:MAG: hypothetical protein DIU78_07005 [Pseudomonadota bacterium]
MPLDTPGLFALASSIDAAVAAAAQGMTIPRLPQRHVALITLAFGGFQAGMPLVGFSASPSFGSWVAQWNPLIAWALLLAVGSKMMAEAAHPVGAAFVNRESFDVLTILVLALATSIDGFAAGTTAPALTPPILHTSLNTGATTALLSIGAVIAGNRIGARLEEHRKSFGGFLLMLFACYTLASRTLGWAPQPAFPG